MIISLSSYGQCTPVAGQVEGAVFTDINYNGVWDPTEVGASDVAIYVFDENGQLVATQPIALDGTYVVSGLADGKSYRLQLEVPKYLSASFVGNDHASDTRFVTVPDCNVYFAVVDPTTYCQHTNPSIAVTCFVKGEAGVNDQMETVVTSPYLFDKNSPIDKIAMKGETGSVFGTVWKSATKELFTASFVKQDAFLKDGNDAIYKSSLANGMYQTSLWVKLGQLGINTGQMAVLDADDCDYGSQVGKYGIGGMEISSDESKLYVVNLYGKSVVVIDINDPRAATTLEIPLPQINCQGGELRPFAIKNYKGELYISATCDASVSQKSSDHTISVWTLDLASKAFNEAFTTSFTREYWKDEPSSHNVVTHWLTDIEFTNDGNMLLGIADRQSHRYCHASLGLINQFPDLLMVWNDNGTWKLENNGHAGPLVGSGVGNGQGPGGGEFFGEDYWILGPLYHPEIATGTLFSLPGSDDVVATVFDPLYSTFSGGYHRYSTENGKKTAAIELYTNNSTSAFGKGSGLGNVIDMCDPAPIQIGNFVWFDDNGNGQQDADELPVTDLEISLVSDKCELVATTSTNAAGEYYFSTELAYHENYFVVISDGRSVPGTGVMINGKTFKPTAVNNGVGVLGDGHDSDGSIDPALTCDLLDGKIVVPVATSGPGIVNHTFDIGVTSQPVVSTPDIFDLALIKTVQTNKPVQLGEIVVFDITLFNQGEIAAQNIDIVDYLTDGYDFPAFLNPGWAMQNGKLIFRHFGQLQPGASATVSLSLQVKKTADLSDYTNYSEIAYAEDIHGAEGNDIDSTPDSDRYNDAGGEPDGNTDDEYHDDGTIDEDDHDPATVRIFDLALTKTTAFDRTVRLGDEVLFNITLYNQGQITTGKIGLVDYLPAGLVLSANDNNGWVQNGQVIKSTYVGELKPGEQAVKSVLLRVAGYPQNGEFVNYAEITSAFDMNDVDLSAYDYDSSPDEEIGNDAGGEPDGATDDEYNDDGTIDEDDHDPAMLKVFDLALRKTADRSTVASSDETITYSFAIFNQGGEPAQNIEVIDHLPDGFNFDPGANPHWQMLDANTLRAKITSLIYPGEEVVLRLKLKVQESSLGRELINYGEIASVETASGEPARDFDSTPDMDWSNDAGGAVGTATDNILDGNGLIDEDDHDPAVVSSAAPVILDLSLEKTTNSHNIQAGDEVIFQLEITNEEVTTVGYVRVVDYLPFFLESIDANWKVTSNGFYIDRELYPGSGLPADGLKAGESVSINLITRVREGVPPGTILNTAEIAAIGDFNNTVGSDMDSNADDDPNNDRSDNDAEVKSGAGVGLRPIEDDRGAAEIVVSTVERRDECTCLNNESNTHDGQFYETIVVTSASGETWWIDEAVNIFDYSSPNPPLAPTPYPAGAQLTEVVLGGGLSTYSIRGKFVQGTAWYAKVRNNFDAILSVEGGQECLYDAPYIVGSTSVCIGGNEPYSVLNPKPGATYQWNLSSGGVISGGGASVSVQWDNGVSGPHILTVEEIAPDNCTAPFSISVEIGDQFVYSVSCIQYAQVSLGPDCRSVVTPQMLLVGGPHDYSAFNVILADEHGHHIPNATLTYEHIGQRVMATVKNACTGNSCWAWLDVEDKMAPEIICFNDTVSCTAMGIYPLPVAIDGCDPDPIVTIIDEQIEAIDCDPDFIKRITRTYVAEDKWGNISEPCVQEIMLRRIRTSDITLPDTFSIAKGNPLICNTFPADSFGRPLPEYTGVPMIGDVRLWPEEFYCSIGVDYIDIELKRVGCVRKMVREWRILEWYCSSGFNMIRYPQYIEITDTVAPEVVCPEIDWVITNTRSCDADVFVPLPEIEDICSNTFRVDLVYPGGYIEDYTAREITLPVDTNILKFRVYDQCYNVDSCEFEVVVLDNTPPVAICDQFTTVGLTDTGLAYIYAHTFDDGSYDNCDLKKMEVKRMDDGSACGFADADQFGPLVEFCCEDIGQNVMVLFQVTDKSGNTNTCMIEVEVQDKIPPRIYCPDDVTISCHDHYDINDLSSFGAPTILDNCDYILEERVVEEIDQCREGYIDRIFIVRDHNNLSSCVQRIHVINEEPFVEDDITWPLDYETTECRESFLTPDQLPERYGYPRVNEDKCDLVGMTYSDLTFPFVDNSEACYKIVRTWKVINWCRFDTFANDGWVYEQVIKVRNSVPPTIVSDCAKIEKCIFDSCERGYIELSASAHDDCTEDIDLRWEFHVDLHNDGIVDHSDFGFGPDILIAREYELGEHNVRWVFEDGCGNKSVCTQYFDLVNCKAPTAYCKNGIVVDLIAMDLDGDGECDTEMVEIWAVDLDDNSSHLCDYPLTYSFGRDTSVKSITFDCDDLGRRDLELCVTDPYGRQSCCHTFVIVQDNNFEDCCMGEFDKDCVVIPGDINLFDCTESVDPADLMSFPITVNCDVDSVATSYSDEDATTGDVCEKIIRTWEVILYLNGEDTACSFSQCITIDNEFTEDSIIWPADSIILMDCTSTIDTATIGGVPQIMGEYCDYVTMSFADVDLTDPDPACDSWERTWTIVNGCDNDREYTFVQYIRLMNQAPPVLTVPGDVTVDNTPGLCVARITLPQVELGDCNTDVVITNNFNSGGGDASGVFPVGKTTIIFTAIDACGNESTGMTCVRVNDVTPPIVTCPDDLTFDCDVSIPDIDFGIVSATDNCSAITIQMDTIYDLGLCDIGTITRRVTVSDTSGNVSTCEQVVTIENQNPFTEDRITWPLDTVELASCETTDPSMTGQPMVDISGLSCFDIRISRRDTMFDGTCDGAPCMILIRTWTVTDSCSLDGMGGGIFIFDQVILIDGEALEIFCPADTTITCEVGLGDLSEYGTFSAMSICGISSETLDTIYDINTCDVGTVTRIYTVEDSSGHMLTCTQVITIEIDNPFTEGHIQWPPDSIEVGGCDSMVTAGEPIIDTSGLSCFNIVVSMEDSTYVDTCDGEPCDIISRKWTVIDSCQLDGMGGGIYCDTQIIIKTGEELSVTCPPDTTLDCDAVLGPLSDYGRFSFTSPCGIGAIILDTIYNLNACSIGTVTRSILVRDTMGNEVSCAQVITIGNDNPFDEGDITWPADTVMIDECSSIHPDSIPDGRPIIDSTAIECAELSINYVDTEMSDCMQTPCLLVTREWTIIDTCQLDGSGGGVFVFTQRIEVNDTTPPAFDGPVLDTTYYVLDTCEFNLSSWIPSVTDCSSNLTITNNSPFADSTGPDAGGIYPVGETEFYFFAEDGCCNVDSVLARVNVLDTIAPRVRCTKIFQTMTDTIVGVKFIARDALITLKDNCSEGRDIMVSFSKTDFMDTCRFYNCDSLRMTGLPNLLYIETVYVKDESGNIDSCEALLQVIDAAGCIPTTLTATINGLIRTEEHVQVRAADVSLIGGGQLTKTDDIGYYSFTPMMKGGQYEVSPLKDDDHLNGVTTKDLVYIHRHLLGMDELDSPYDLIAADINNSGDVTARDLTDLRRLLLGYYTEFPSNTSWRFVDKLYVFPDPQDPWLEVWPENYMIDPLVTNMHIDFVGMKIGDVTGDVSFDGGGNKVRHDHPMVIGYELKDDMYTFYKVSDEAVKGFQTTLSWHPGAETFDLELSEEGGMHEENFGYHSIDQGILTVVSEVALGEGKVELFSIPSGAVAGLVKADGSITAKMAYDALMDPIDLEIVDISGDGEVGYMLYQNKPNPFRNTTIIGFELPSDQKARISVLSVNGVEVYQDERTFSRGYNEIEIGKDKLIGSGIYYYRLDAEGFSEIMKMINID